MRVKLTVAYDGTNYHGWQIQNNALSVEEVLAGALRELLGEEIELTGASRTDAGVHALGMWQSSIQIPEFLRRRLLWRSTSVFLRIYG